MRRKGGMELSINAIVVLIIAMVVLGIGILFIRGMFSKAQITTYKALTAQETTNPASADRPLVADKEVTISPSSPTATVAVSAYNLASATASDLNILLGPCISSSTGGNVLENISFTPVFGGTVQSNQFASYQVLVGMKKGKNNKASSYPFVTGDSIACTLSSSSLTVGELNRSTTVVIKVQASG